MFAEDDLTCDAFLSGRLRLWQPKRGYRAAIDPVLLAAAVPATAGQTVLDLGCGAGAAGLCLATRVPEIGLAGLELQPAYAELARRNSVLNAVAFEVHEGDLTRMPRDLRRGFDHVIANPPYHDPGGTPSPDAGRDRALRVDTPVADWLAAAARRLHPGGTVTMILGADCLPEALAGFGRLGSVAALPLAAREGRAAGRVILQARKGGRAAFRLLAPLILHAGAAHDGDRESYAPGAAAVLRQGAALTDRFR
jgi:tRNA1Val (adenine37-N6)-methyltransferase